MIKIGYMTITPEISGAAIVGPSVYKMAPDTIEVLDVMHMVRHEFDPAHGTPSGDRKHEPFQVIKAVDVTTPQLYVMCVNAEMCTSVEIKYFVQVGNAPDPVDFYSWTLTNAYIVEVRQVPARELADEYAEQYDLLEEISFAYQTIEWHHFAHRAPIGLKDLDDTIQADSWSSMA